MGLQEEAQVWLSGGIFLNSDIMFIKAFAVNIGIQFAFMIKNYGCHNCD